MSPASTFAVWMAAAVMEPASERAANNEELCQELREFTHRLLSSRGKKTPEEVAILPAVVKLLLKR
ncbi:MAG: hypothetical protein K5841_10385 [Fretibacterium sp.]|nr:hypothetical protein [Fretibacterium sp.]